MTCALCDFGCCKAAKTKGRSAFEAIVQIFSVTPTEILTSYVYKMTPWGSEPFFRQWMYWICPPT